MKNLKTIIGALVLTMVFFGCQTNDEVIEFETSNKLDETTSSRYRGDEDITEDTTILFKFKAHATATDQQNIRDEFDQYLDVKTITACNTTRPHKEVWVVTNITPVEFYTILVQLGYEGSVPGDAVLADDDDEIIKDYGLFSVVYSGDCSSL